jgi:uncharacterized protein (TIGR02588 family)
MSDSRGGEGEEQGGNGGPGGEEQKKVSPWEWVVAGVSTLLVLGVIGFMGHEALSAPSTPPLIDVRVDTVIAVSGGYLVEFRASNSGQSTASGVTIEGELKADTGTVEKSEVTIDYVPSQAHRKGGLYFSKDPAKYKLEIRPKGYDRP